MKTAIASVLVIMATMSANSFAQGTASLPKDTPKVEAAPGNMVPATPKQKNHFPKKHPSQGKERVPKKPGH